MHRLRFIYLSICLLLSAEPSIASDSIEAQRLNRIDSLQLIIEEGSVGDSLLVDALLTLGREMRPLNSAAALEHSRQALSIAQTLDHPEMTARIMVHVGHLYWRLGNFKQSYDYLHEARVIFEHEGNDVGYARALNHLGILLSGQGYYDNALEYYFRALSIYEEADSIVRSASVLNNIGIVYQQQGSFDRAEEFHLRSLAISKDSGNERGKAFSLNNLGSVSQDRGNYAEALAYFEASLAIRERYPDLRELAYTKRNIGYLNYLKGKFDEALEELLLTSELYIQISDDRGLARVNHDLGEVYKAFGHYDLAYAGFNKSLDIAGSIGLPSIISENYQSLSDLMAARNNFQAAYDYLRRFRMLQDSIYDNESKSRVLELQLMYDRERKEDEIELLLRANQINTLNMEKQKQFRNFLLLLIVLIVVLFLFIYYRFREARNTNRLLKSQKEEISYRNRQLQDLNKRLLEEKQKVENLNKKLKDSEKHLIQVNKTKDQFFSIISHDLRNPFASIVSFSRILKRDIENLSRDELLEMANELDKSVIKINALLDNLLQWSRTQSGKIDFHPERFELKDIIRDNMNLFSNTAGEKNIHMSDQVEERLMVWGDVNMTNTIIRNLLSNALKYTETGGRVVLESRKFNGMAEISVIDNGVGISPEAQQKLFRADTLHSTYGTRDEKGSGLGLLLCKEFVQKQGGTISLKSKEGKGSVFTFTIPLEAPAK